MGAARVFVYGTLMPGQPGWPSLSPYVTGWAAATAGGRLWDTGRGYPAARFDDDGGRVAGVVVELGPARAAEAVAVLDLIEGEGSLYRRVEVITSTGPAEAYEWLGPVEGMAALADGWPGALP